MSIEKDCKKIHKRIRKFYEKYKDKRNICFNLQCDKENDSYDICLYVNPKIEELDVMKENIKLERKKLCKKRQLGLSYKNIFTDEFILGGDK